VLLLDFASPILLAGTAQTHAYHAEAAVRESHRVHGSAGHGSAIFVFAGRRSAPTGAAVSDSSIGWSR